MITIVQCVNNLDLGGLEQVALTLASGLKRRGIRSLICCVEDRGQLAGRAADSDVEVVALNAMIAGKRNAHRAFRQLLNACRPNVVHSHNFKPFYYGSLARLRGATDGHIHTRHGAFIAAPRALWRYRLLRPWTDRVTTVTADRRDELAGLTGRAAADVAVIPNGIDTETFCPATDRRATRQALDLPLDCRAIIVVARLAPEKDLATLLRAFALLQQKMPATELWIVGDGPEEARLQTVARELAILSPVRFLGRRTDIPQLLQAAEVFALSSVSEGLSIALIEAAACGLPIVATDVGGNREVVNPPAGGRLVAARDAGALATALESVLIDEPRRLEMSRAARLHAVQKFGLDQMLDRYLSLYQAALGRHGIRLPDDVATAAA